MKQNNPLFVGAMAVLLLGVSAFIFIFGLVHEWGVGAILTLLFLFTAIGACAYHIAKKRERVGKLSKTCFIASYTASLAVFIAGVLIMKYADRLATALEGLFISTLGFVLAVSVTGVLAANIAARKKRQAQDHIHTPENE